MGQQASSSSSPPAPPAPRRCCGSAADGSSVPSRVHDTVTISPLFLSSAADSKAEVYRPTAAISGKRALPAAEDRQERRSFGCGVSSSSGPEVYIESTSARTATAQWTYGGLPGATLQKYHVEVLYSPPGSGTDRANATEVAFFEVPASHSVLELPAGTLQRASGPYMVRVVAEGSTPQGAQKLSGAGFSQPFRTPAESPSPVRRLQRVVDLASQSGGEPAAASQIRVQWEPPADDGGASIQHYVVALQPAAGQDHVEPETKEVRTCDCAFEGLAPGSGPLCITVCACNRAGLQGEAASLETSTPAVAPSKPSDVRATLCPSHSTEQDLIHLEFVSPDYDGGSNLESFRVYVLDDGAAIGDDGVQLPSTLRKQAELPSLLCEVQASEVEVSRDKQLSIERCECDVGVPPNRLYRFAVSAYNGTLESEICSPSRALLVPARVPPPPQAAPQVLSLAGAHAVEVRWDSLSTGGGLPLRAFKVGVLAQDPNRNDWDVNNILKEVSVSLQAAKQVQAPAKGRQPPRSAAAVAQGDQWVKCSTKIEGLDCDKQYRVVLAATNALGTGLWSKLSPSVRTPMAAPLQPTGPVATLTRDDSQGEVLLSVSWALPNSSGQPSRAPIKHFEVRLKLMPGQGKGKLASLDRTDTVAAPSAQRGREQERHVWSATLPSEGLYSVEITTCSIHGGRSAPASLQVEAKEELFKALPSCQLTAPPVWSEDPLAVLGESTAEKSDELRQLFPSVLALQWRQTLFLWQEDSKISTASEKTAVMKPTLSTTTMNGGVDVLCCFRHPEVQHGRSVSIGLATSVSTCRLLAALPSCVPFSVRLRRAESEAKVDGSGGGSAGGAAPLSDPLVLELAESGEICKAEWEVWARQHRPPRWIKLPQQFHAQAEAAWIEGASSVRLHLTEEMASAAGAGGLQTGDYELVFGDDCRVQHHIKKLGASSWQGNARRIARGSSGTVAGEERAGGGPTPASDAQQCVICMERARTHAFMHSDTGDGHLGVCEACAQSFTAARVGGSASRVHEVCPMCRRPFTSLQRIYQ